MGKLAIPQATSPLDAWLYYIAHLHYKSIDLSLDRIRYIATILGLMHPASQVIIVGGTNGKGTTCHLIEVILLTIGLRVGVYSSPHLLKYTERIRIQGKELSESIHSIAFSKIEASRGKTPLSIFEFGTLAALQIFQESKLDVVILEVGLGGRLDATNIISADVAVITSIALDHTEYLGTNRESIAQEKAGIVCRNKPIVVGEPDRPTTFDAVVLDNGAILYAYNRDWWWFLKKNGWDWWDKERRILLNLPLPNIPLNNAATAIATIQCLPFIVPEIVIHAGLRNTFLPGRFQCISRSPLIILDVAHNPHAAHYLSIRLKELLSPTIGIVHAIVGMLADKDIAGTLDCLRDQVKVWYCVSLDDPRAASASLLATYFDDGEHIKQFEKTEHAWHQAMLDSTPEDCIIVFGSFRIVASVMSYVKGKQCHDNK
ncbi:bifunctional tetrahydrofolate synthase/dihydrofolate synthase [Candidatus Curculioniphilus buchneri]|uniref:bifunctional tetrahydrofolate synthase/dihydrofolate synthase n=1 Tax=Candidatus Curculioniphilus buchneri TaxID=690594 RepID=UPI00376ECF33